jgi:putative spermidine/putrescine transport system ATP-binding protein
VAGQLASRYQRLKEYIMARVTLEDLGKSFGGQNVIDHVSLDIKEGEFLTFLGPSGCGKTTTLRIVAGFVAPDKGRVMFDGTDMTNTPTQKRRLGMVFQDYALFPHLNVADNIGFALRAGRMAKGDISKRVRELLALIRLPAVAERFPLELSGGQQQRVAIARALAHTPAVLLMDEPLGALDLKLREAMQHELAVIQQKLGITTIYVTHDQEEALSLSDRVALMRRGKIEQLGTPREIYGNPATPFSAFFLGKINFLSGKLVDQQSGIYRISTSKGILLSPVKEGRRFSCGDQVSVAVRPEHLRLESAGHQDGSNVVTGGVVRQKFTGKIVQFEVRVDERTNFFVDSTVDSRVETDAQVQVAWDVSATHLYHYEDDPEIGVGVRNEQQSADQNNKHGVSPLSGSLALT